MPTKRRRREGFDYFVDKYESTYYDDFGDEYDDYIPGDRFQQRNRYTGEIAGKPHFINTSSVFIPQQTPQGTIEFSAVPNYGGFDPNARPLGDQTMVFNTNAIPANNPYMMQSPTQAQLMNTHQVSLNQQKSDIENRVNTLDSKFEELNKKVENVTKTIEATTGTLAFRSDDYRTGGIPRQTGVIPAGAPGRTRTMTAARPMSPTSTVATKNVKAAKNKKKKVSKGAIIGAIFGILIALGLIVAGVLMIMGIIKF